MSQFIEMFGGLCQDTPWSDVVTITNGKAYPEEYQEEGAYPICGSGGIMCYGEKKLCNGNTTILGRKGNINNPIFMESGYWIVDTAFSIDVDKAKLHPKFFYYWCCQYDFTKLNKQGVLPSLTRKDLEKVKMAIPQMRDQLKFVSIAEQADKSKFGDFKSQFIEMFGNPVTNTKGWKTAKIKDVAPEMPSKEQLSGKIWLLNLDMIESNTGRIIEKVYEDVENALSVQSFDEGNVLFSKLRPYLNKVVIPDEPGMATTELVPLRPEPSKLHKVFLSHLLRGNQFVNYANDIAGGTKMPRMPLTELRNFDCILPPMDKQLEFVFIAEQVDKSKFGDFKSQFIEMFGNPLSLNQKNELKRLGECCILNPRRPNIALCDTDKVSFIPMPAVSEDGYLVDMTDEEYGKVKKSFTYFENNDVLFAKITPCMENGKGAIVHGLTNGIGMGSTEFHVLRPINGISSPYWLLALTRMPIFRERAAKNMSGTGGQKRVSASYLDHFMVGLPAIEEQRRFEAIYRQADKSKSVIQKALVYLNDIQSDELGKIA